MVKVMIRHGVDVNAVDAYGRRTALAHAIMFNTSAVNVLIEAGADVESQVPGLKAVGESPLCLACSVTYARDAVFALLKSGADTCKRNADGRTPLFLAAESAQSREAKRFWADSKNAGTRLDAAKAFWRRVRKSVALVSIRVFGAARSR